MSVLPGRTLPLPAEGERRGLVRTGDFKDTPRQVGAPMTAREAASRLKRGLVRGLDRRHTHRGWQQRHRQVYALHPEYRTPLDPTLEAEHARLWGALLPRIYPDTLRVCSHISGTANPEYMPEEVYVSVVEPCLNPREEVAFLANKSTYERWFGQGIFPRAWLHRIEGAFYDADLNPLTTEQALSDVLAKITYPIILKPNRDSYGGAGVETLHSRAELDARLPLLSGHVLQERIEQHPALARFNPAGLNTLRVCLYRSVLSGEVHVLNAALRMGVRGSLDNETAGGIVCCLDEGGRLNPYAVDKYGQRFPAHPDTGIVFADVDAIPQFDELGPVARRVAAGVVLARLVSLDMTLDKAGTWRVIENNLSGQTIRFAQYAGRPFLGPFTHEVIEYCRAHA